MQNIMILRFNDNKTYEEDKKMSNPINHRKRENIKMNKSWVGINNSPILSNKKYTSFLVHTKKITTPSLFIERGTLQQIIGNIIT